MPRANRHFLPGHVWHITHRCHDKKFLLKLLRDPTALFALGIRSQKAFGLSVLDYMVTYNHVDPAHLVGASAHWDFKRADP
jgi:putative transposase